MGRPFPGVINPSRPSASPRPARRPGQGDDGRRATTSTTASSPRPLAPGPGGGNVGIVVRNLSKRFGRFQAVDGVSFEVPAGQLVALLGPSGSGKSTILRIIAGLEPADSGEVELTGEEATHLPAQRRGVGFVFQHYALFRHMTIRQNVAFGLEAQRPRPPAREVRARVDELLELVQLIGYADRYPTQLSGGQRQRVALARALAPRPKVLLLDEPFGALDSKVRDELRSWLRRLHDEVHVTSLFVTHDQQEAFEVADQVVVLNKGKVEQMGPPQRLYEHPATPFVTEFLGSVNILRPETVLGMDQVDDEAPLPLDIPGPNGQSVVYVRPHDLEISRQRNGRPAWTARVRRLIPLGGLVRLDLTLLDGTTLNVQLTRERCLELALADGDHIYVTPKDIKVFHDSKTFVQ
ncbi:MAG: sulfate/molybdate ABC transporter ATP-binding protein, partial [Planctomycetaceae bacterium]|nr:sulfate/molybdate ABC transporter ATP-binding protein [Planctomycetaceae bacterium]